jgi:tRNA-Thr(GGU) m(6)t(6)A37 methyltransferase TsaA
MSITYTPIGTIRSPYQDKADMPIQPTGAGGVKGSVELLAEYTNGLADLDGFSHIILLYHFHRSEEFQLKVVPFMDSEQRGLFSTRAPKRPNPIGLSIVQLERIEDNILHINNVDVLDGTPLLDIKPYIPEFDAQTDVRTGWFKQSRETVSQYRSDERFK